MKDDGSKRKRCTECRRWFQPPVTAAKSQRVCGAECRRKRRRRLARGRRWKRLQDHRVDERKRQQECRQRRREQEEKGAAVPVTGPRHAPPSAPNSADLMVKVLESWDRAQALSRATLRREITTILRGKGPISGTEAAAVTPLSRATFGQ